jgi:rhomboid protease GluP
MNETPIQEAPRIEPQRLAISLPGGTPYVVYILLGITIAAYALQFVGQILINRSCSVLLDININVGTDYAACLGMKVNEMILQGQYWRLITPMFLHGSLLHIGFNMYALYAIGPALERFYGHWRFALLYLLAGFAGNVLSFAMSPAPSYGASTAIFGLIGAQGIFLYHNRKLFGASARSGLINVILIAAVNLAIGLSSRGIDNWGHIGGLVGGLLFAILDGPKLQVEPGGIAGLRAVDSRRPFDALLAAVVSGGLFFALTVGIILIR